MLAQKNNGRVLLKLALVLIVLGAIGFVALLQFRPIARVKAANRQRAADAVTGTVLIDAQGGTRDFKSQAEGRVAWCEPLQTQSAKFKKGDALLKLDSTELERQIGDTKRAFENASYLKRFDLTGGKPELLDHLGPISDEELAKKYRDLSPKRKLLARNLENLERQLKLNAVAEEDVRAAQRTLEDFDNGLKRMVVEDKNAEANYQSTLKTLNEQLERMTIVAPSDGQLHEMLTWEGALIGRGQVVATWFANERLVAAKISEESFAKVKLGQQARLRLLSYGDQPFDAEVSGFHPKADDAQRFTVFLKVKVDHPEDVLRPGSTGEATITIDAHDNALMVPRRAVFDSDKVLVVSNGHVEKRKVKIGFVSLNLAEILDGLKDGEQVVVDELDQFHDGQRVQVEVVK